MTRDTSLQTQSVMQNLRLSQIATGSSLCLLRIAIADPYVRDGSNLRLLLFFVFTVNIFEASGAQECVSQRSHIYHRHQTLSFLRMSLSKVLIFVMRVARIFTRVFKLPQPQTREVQIEAGLVGA